MSALKGQGAMVYGIVQYDFQAERPDELSAKAGEAIIVIAQSNPEWFVAKPIGRLGGPGLIPVSFLELRDMQSGQAVSDPLGAVRRAGVPKVEEWKKMTAEYKNSSISLGKIETGGSSGGSQMAVSSGMSHMSLGGHQSQQTLHDNYVCHVSNPFLGFHFFPNQRARIGSSTQCQQRNNVASTHGATKGPTPHFRLYFRLLFPSRRVLVYHECDYGR